MIAIDTNLVIRVITGDDQAQLDAARELMSQSDVFVSFGVLMESEWVLRSQYRMSRQEVNTALAAFVRLGHVNLPDREGIGWALERHAEGADLADMLHLIDSGSSEHFATFDRDMAAHAGMQPPIPILTL